jgi:hypothetical protein
VLAGEEEGVRDGVVEGLERRAVLADKARPWPKVDAQHPQFEQIRARRQAARERSGFPAARADGEGRASGSIWFCDFLWNKTYVTIGGDVRPCCVDGVPVVGNAVQEPFERVWNNDNYVAMRQRLVAKDPVPACRGCMHVQEISDPARIAKLLLGARPPEKHELPPMPDALDPMKRRRQRSGTPPKLEWPAVDDASNYVLQFSLDGFASILWSTDGPMGGAIRTNSYQVPVWAWRDAPVDRVIEYRVLARRPDGHHEVARGSVGAEVEQAGQRR